MTPDVLTAELKMLTRLMATATPAEIERRTRALLSAAPDDPRLLCLLGRVLRQQGRRAEAGEALRQAASRAPRAAQVMSELGYLALENEAWAEAERHFRQLTTLHPNVVDGYFNLGMALKHQGKLDEAIAAFEYCLAHGGRAAEQIHTELGTARIMRRQEETALEHFNAALALKPDYAAALHGIGMVKSAYGTFDDAAKYFRAAMQSDPDFIEAYQQLVSIRRFEDPDDPDIAAMEALAADESRPELTRESIRFALGKVCDDVGAYARAFEHYAAANALKKKRLPRFDAEGLARYVDRLMEVYDAARVARRPADVDGGDLPIFVVGMPRSGTTLVEQIIASHSAVDAGGEHSFMERARRERLAPYPESMRNPDAVVLRTLIDEYLAELAAYRVDGRHVTDKMPANFFHLGLINDLFPRARFICLRRDIRDNALSIFFQNMPGGHYYANDLADIRRYYDEHMRLMAHWHSVFKERIHVVDYEALVADPDTGVRNLLAYVSLPFEESCLDFSRRKGAVATLSLWQVRQPLYTRSAGRWTHYAEQLAANGFDTAPAG